MKTHGVFIDMKELNDFEHKGWVKFKFDERVVRWANAANLKITSKLKNKEISLSEFSLKTKKASLEDSKLLLMEVLSDNNLEKLSFSQIDYIQKMLIKINNYQKLSLG